MTITEEVAAIRDHRSLMHQPCCVEHPDGSRSKCDIDTLLEALDTPPTVRVNVSTVVRTAT